MTLLLYHGSALEGGTGPWYHAAAVIGLIGAGIGTNDMNEGGAELVCVA